MQYPQIQFYRGSLVRLASGELKQVEDLSSDDFLESARLAANLPATINIAQSPVMINTANEQPAAVSHHHHQSPSPSASSASSNSSSTSSMSFNTNNQCALQLDADLSLYIDSSVVRDFLEVGPPCSASPTSSTGSLNNNNSNNNNNNHHHQRNNNHNQHTNTSQYPVSSTSSSASDLTAISSASSGSLANMMSANVTATTAATTTRLQLQQQQQHHQLLKSMWNQTVLIKFFLETSRSVAFIEVPIEHPFFVFHRGWSSFNPHRTYDKFGLKCRKLKIGDTCISLIRKCVKHQTNECHQQESDQCNILFSSIKIHE